MPISVTFDEIVKVVSALQPRKAFAPILTIFPVLYTLVRFLQPLKAEASIYIFFTDLGRYTFFSAVQLRKVLLSITNKSAFLSANTIFASFLQFSKTGPVSLPYTHFTLAGMVMEVIPEPAKALPPI